MANAVVASNQGKSYQARMFWLHVCDLFAPESKVDKIGFEVDDRRSLDDIAVHYGDGMIDEHGAPLLADHISVKFHVDQSGEVTFANLAEPSFIHATSTSFLQRVHALQQRHAPAGTGVRFVLASPWRIDPDDPLGELCDSASGAIRLDALARGKTDDSSMGAVRKLWREHLQLNDDDALAIVVRTVRIRTQHVSLEALTQALNARLPLAGLQPIVAGRMSTLYDDLPWKLTEAKLQEFTRQDIETIAEREGLLLPPATPSARQFAVRSFVRGTERVQGAVPGLVDLSSLFDGRAIRDERLWHERVLPEIELLTREMTRANARCELHLHSHYGIAFALGHFLDAKAGVQVAPVQSGYAGDEAWWPERSRPIATDTIVQVSTSEMASAGRDVAVAIAVTHDIGDDVAAFVRAKVPCVGRVIVARLHPSPSTSGVRDATHAWRLAQDIASAIRGRFHEEREGRLHLFIAAPKALVFFLGQESRSFGPVTIYEHDQEANTATAYTPGIALPARATTTHPH